MSDQAHRHSAAFKAKVALAAVRGDKTPPELAQQHDVDPNQISDWKYQLLAKAADVFGGELRRDEPTVDLKVLHAKIGQSALENRNKKSESRCDQTPSSDHDPLGLVE